MHTNRYITMNKTASIVINTLAETMIKNKKE